MENVQTNFRVPPVNPDLEALSEKPSPAASVASAAVESQTLAGRFVTKAATIFNKLPIPDGIKQKVMSVARRVVSFVNNNKGAIFFGLTLAFCLLGPGGVALSSFSWFHALTTGVVTALSLKAVTLLVGIEKALGPKKRDEMLAVLGAINIVVRFVVPGTAAAAAIFNIGVAVGALVSRHITRLFVPTT